MTLTACHIEDPLRTVQGHAFEELHLAALCQFWGTVCLTEKPGMENARLRGPLGRISCSETRGFITKFHGAKPFYDMAHGSTMTETVPTGNSPR